MPSPNFGPRRDGLSPALIVLHFTGMTDAQSARARLCDPQAKVSAHWLLYENGMAEALVPEAMRAWHAGAGSWRGLGDVNSRSIGVEIVNPGDQPYPDAQMQGLAILLRGIMDRWGITRDRVIGHSDMAPGRKQDPGPRFDWRRLALQGLALWPETPGSPDAPLEQSLNAIGYPPVDPQLRLQAFRLRFAPWMQGPETRQDRAIADAVAGIMAGDGIRSRQC